MNPDHLSVFRVFYGVLPIGNVSAFCLTVAGGRGEIL